MADHLKQIFVITCLVLLSTSLSAQESKIDRFAFVVDSIHSQFVFPHHIGPGVDLTNIGVDKDEKMLVINYMLNPEFVETVVKNISSENGIAQLLTGYDEIFSISMIEADAGFRAIITSPSANGLNQTKIVDVPASAIPIVYSKLKNGDYSSLKSYLEMLEATFTNMDFPVKVAEGIYLIKGFIENKDANWVYRINGNIDKSLITDAVIQNNRINLLNNLRANLSPDYVKEIEDQGIRLHYSYLDEKDNLLFEFIFSSDDLR